MAKAALSSEGDHDAKSENTDPRDPRTGGPARGVVRQRRREPSEPPGPLRRLDGGSPRRLGIPARYRRDGLQRRGCAARYRRDGLQRRGCAAPLQTRPRARRAGGALSPAQPQAAQLRPQLAAGPGVFRGARR